MSEKLALPQAKAMVKEILAAAPETKFRVVEDNCVYFDESGNPSCVIGHVFAKIGITPDQVSPADNTTILNCLYHVCGEKITTPTMEWLQDIQSHQDCGISWGEILEEEFGAEDN